MKKHFTFIYWGVMAMALALILMSVMESFEASFFLSCMMLPGVLFVKYFSKDISFANRKQGILHTTYFIASFILIEYLAIILVTSFIYQFSLSESPEIIINPIFICFILVSLLSIEEVLNIKFMKQTEPEINYITFTSDRVKITLDSDSILFIESRDYEVSVMTISGETYSTRMKISQWESVLDNRFIRVHRAFIVNKNHITMHTSKSVTMGNFTIEISRKYKDTVMQNLTNKNGNNH